MSNENSNVGTVPMPAPAVGRNVVPNPSDPSSLLPTPGPRPQPAAASTPPAEPERANGTLTRRGMEQVIAQGGSVSLGGKIFVNLADLPTQEQLDAFNAAHARKMADESPAALAASIGSSIGAAVQAALAPQPTAAEPKLAPAKK